MIRLCIHCRHVFGCQENDGEKNRCSTCNGYDDCKTRTAHGHRAEDVTGGICDGCFENLIVPKYKQNKP